MKSALFYFIIILFIVSCCKREKADIISFDLIRTDYIEKITASGTIQAVNTRYIKTPPIGFVNVVYLSGNGAYVKKGDTVCILECPELVNELESYTLTLENMMGELKKIEADNALQLSMLEAQIENNEIQVSINSLDSVQQRFAPPVQQKLIALEMEKANIEKMKLQKKYAAQKIISETELRSMRSRIKQRENRIRMMQDWINMLTVLSPADGIVLHTEAPSILFFGGGTVGGKIEEGSTVYADMTLLELPDISEMEVSVAVPESDYKRIETGQKVYIGVDAVRNLMTTGSVRKKMPVGKSINRDSKVKVYEVIVKIDSCHSLMYPGLSATCDVIINEMKDTVVVPTIAIFNQDSSKIVYVALNQKFIPVSIETGLSNSSESVVTKGLTGIETIALMKPPEKMILQRATNGEDETQTPAIDPDKNRFTIDTLQNRYSKFNNKLFDNQ